MNILESVYKSRLTHFNTLLYQKDNRNKFGGLFLLMPIETDGSQLIQKQSKKLHVQSIILFGAFGAARFHYRLFIELISCYHHWCYYK